MRRVARHLPGRFWRKSDELKQRAVAILRQTLKDAFGKMPNAARWKQSLPDPPRMRFLFDPNRLASNREFSMPEMFPAGALS
jgi:hypothetical protein